MTTSNIGYQTEDNQERITKVLVKGYASQSTSYTIPTTEVTSQKVQHFIITIIQLKSNDFIIDIRHVTLGKILSDKRNARNDRRNDDGVGDVRFIEFKSQKIKRISCKKDQTV